VSSRPLLLLGVFEVLIGDFAERVGTPERRLRSFISGVFAVSHEAKQAFRLFAGLLRRPRGPVRADCEETLAPGYTILDDIGGGAALAPNTKPRNRFQGGRRPGYKLKLQRFSYFGTP